MPSALLNLFKAEQSIYSGLSSGTHPDLDKISDSIDSLADRIYYRYMDGVVARPILCQEAWMNRTDALQKRLQEIDMGLYQLFNEWIDAIWAYRSWVTDTMMTGLS